jgi:hypothetical protein
MVGRRWPRGRPAPSSPAADDAAAAASRVRRSAGAVSTSAATSSSSAPRRPPRAPARRPAAGRRPRAPESHSSSSLLPATARQRLPLPDVADDRPSTIASRSVRAARRHGVQERARPLPRRPAPGLLPPLGGAAPAKASPAHKFRPTRAESGRQCAPPGAAAAPARRVAAAAWADHGRTHGHSPHPHRS